MSTEAQIKANQQNAQHSTGPKTEAGKSTSSRNNFRFGFTGAFTVLASEDQDEFDHLLHGLSIEHQVKTMTERILILKMAQHHWLSLRAQRLQDVVMDDRALTLLEKERQFALYLRYQTTNDRAFSRALNNLLKLKAERRKEEIGFESQERKRNEQKRAEERKEERHKWDIMLAEARLDHQMILSNNLEMDKIISETNEARKSVARKAA